MYHLPLLPGYDPNVNVRSSAFAKSPRGASMLLSLSEAEENGYVGTYFDSSEPEEPLLSDGFIPSLSPTDRRAPVSDAEDQPVPPRPHPPRPRAKSMVDERLAEVIFFAYGVVVFFGLQEHEERMIIDDIDTAGVLTRRIDEENWEIEECHYAVCDTLSSAFGPSLTVCQYDPNAAYPRIYNDLFSQFSLNLPGRFS